MMIRRSNMKNLSAAILLAILGATSLSTFAAPTPVPTGTQKTVPAAVSKAAPPAAKTAPAAVTKAAATPAKTTAKPVEKAAAKPAGQTTALKTQNQASKIVCKDGTQSNAKTTHGACSKHGGIAKKS